LSKVLYPAFMLVLSSLKFISRVFHLKQCEGFSEVNKHKCVEKQNKLR